MLLRMLFPMSSPFQSFCLLLFQQMLPYSKLLGYCQLFPCETPLNNLQRTILKAFLL